MFTFLYQWIQNIAFYLILVTVFVQLIPDSGYKKYVRFFTGLLLIVLLTAPILKVFGMEGEFKRLYQSAEYSRQLEEMEEKAAYLNKISIEDYITEDGIADENQP